MSVKFNINKKLFNMLKWNTSKLVSTNFLKKWVNFDVSYWHIKLFLINVKFIENYLCYNIF